MNTASNILTDNFNRKHTYLRISLTEKCNLRCTYCMPAAGIPLAPRAHLMTANEVFEITKLFVTHGVSKIRLTGGEPLVRKDFEEVIRKLATLNVEIAITTNGILLERFLPLLRELGITNITISIDSLNAEKNQQITRRNYFETVWNTIKKLQTIVNQVKLNVVLMKGINDNEIINFVELTRFENLKIRFIEFMPFDGNEWNTEKLVKQTEILEKLKTHFYTNQVIRVTDAPNDTSRNFKIHGFRGDFAIISSVTNPFCDSCNRIRLTADGKLKNCLFSASESELLTDFRNGLDITPKIKLAMLGKHKYRGGMDTMAKLEDPKLHSNNRSMIAIGG
ncbi:GTP 3',8-cyclase MoaA [Aquimarina agarilytica]|uniref:GTP 3',8-cyclase MoaA n=1 Tax=Aquimarina agarilytica TaxID=1087449 RepID=UPI0002887F32|nr:GTP 3',8-cyclase MoaA [Aquimarina agarilytica]